MTMITIKVNVHIRAFWSRTNAKLGKLPRPLIQSEVITGKLEWGCSRLTAKMAMIPHHSLYPSLAEQLHSSSCQEVNFIPHILDSSLAL